MLRGSGSFLKSSTCSGGNGLTANHYAFARASGSEAADDKDSSGRPMFIRESGSGGQ